MRACVFCLAVFAACGATNGSGTTSRGKSGKSLPLTKVVFRQYYKGAPVFILESLSGRDMVEMRSKPIQQRGVKSAFVPDDVMARLLKDLRKFGFYDHAGARPRNPISVGGRAELTVIGENRRMDAFIRRNGQGKQAYETYKQCVDTFRAVHAHYSRFQATSGGGDFGVKKVEFGDTDK